MAGPVAALFLARDGHDVTLVERVGDPRPVGAGILLQPLGQQALAELGLLEILAARSMPVRRFDGRTRSGRPVLDFGYPDPDVCGLGVHRGELFTILWAALGLAGVETRTGVPVNGVRSDTRGWWIDGPGIELGPFDLIVAADGARSRIRRQLGLASNDVGYPYGALWSVVDDPSGLACDVLTQAYDTTRVTLGILPTGVRQASIFWLLRSRDLDRAVAGGPEWLRAAARPYAGKLAPLLDGMATVLGARYRDVVAARPLLADRRGGVVLIGDAAHAMSPQLGMGASLAFADAWSLADALRGHPNDVPAALEAHAADRRAHVRWYTWLSRIMTPVFQSDLVPVGWARDLAFGPMGRLPWVRRQFVGIEMGRQTSPWTSWSPPSDR